MQASAFFELLLDTHDDGIKSFAYSIPKRGKYRLPAICLAHAQDDEDYDYALSKHLVLLPLHRTTTIFETNTSLSGDIPYFVLIRSYIFKESVEPLYDFFSMNSLHNALISL